MSAPESSPATRHLAPDMASPAGQTPPPVGGGLIPQESSAEAHLEEGYRVVSAALGEMLASQVKPGDITLRIIPEAAAEALEMSAALRRQRSDTSSQ